MAVRVGAQVQPQHTEYAQMRDTWLRVEEMGADTLFNWDHFYPLRGEPVVPDRVVTRGPRRVHLPARSRRRSRCGSRTEEAEVCDD